MHGISKGAGNRERGFQEAAHVLRSGAYDFSAKYMAVCTLHHAVAATPDAAGPGTLSVLREVLLDPALSCQTQSYFLFKEAALTLRTLIISANGSPIGNMARENVMALLGVSSGTSHRALAEAVGGLPLSVQGPDPGDDSIKDVRDVHWNEILSRAGMVPGRRPVFRGRSLVMRGKGQQDLLVLKFARSHDSLHTLLNETRWMRFLRDQEGAFSLRFDIPAPLSLQGRFLFRLRGLPGEALQGGHLHRERYAVCFKAHPEYFRYPNEWRTGKGCGDAFFQDVMFRNARLFGQLTAMGVIHRAPIPLFHNRVQGARRPDRGLYEWHRGGRLDRWLESCAYPNFGPTGIRDFEHFISAPASGNALHQRIGDQLLGLFLVAGSHFRNRDPKRVGLDGQGRPVDARDLFDKDRFRELVQGMFLHYYRGFVGRFPSRITPFAWEKLTTRMIEEMGVDRHMEEVLRVVDQNQMDEEAFRDFLRERGYTDMEASGFKKGEKDITLFTGPHLGGFNQRISLPELTEALATMSALCVLGRHVNETSIKKG